tara:strand:+ start:254 stop:445 length:192 start_codon:yes stop_codon:yes gene_type:complete
MNTDNVKVKMPGTFAFEKAFKIFFKQYPNLKNEPIMYMCTSNGYDYFKHSLTRENFKTTEGGN